MNGHIPEERRPELLPLRKPKISHLFVCFWFDCEYRHVENCYGIVRYSVDVCGFEMSIVTENKEHCVGTYRRSVFYSVILF